MEQIRNFCVYSCRTFCSPWSLEGYTLPQPIRPACRLAAALLCAGLLACSPAVPLPTVERCDRVRSAICNAAPIGVDSADCVLYFVRDGRLCWRALHEAASGVLIEDETRTVTAVAAGEGEIFFLSRADDTTALGRVDSHGRVEYDLGVELPPEAERLCWSAGELFCADRAGYCYRLAELRTAELMPVGRVWAMTADAILFAEGTALRACLRSDYATITALAALPGGGAADETIAALAIDQATEEETRIYVLCTDGQLASFADGSWSLHGAPWTSADPSRLTTVADGCLVTDAEGVWYVDASGGVERICAAGEFAVAEELVYTAPYEDAPIEIGQR